MAQTSVRIIRTLSESQLRAVQALFQDYVNSLEIDLAFQDYDSERQNFPHAYAALLAAEVDGQIAGAVALKRFRRDICEMKRLYCDPRFRGLGLGRQLAEAIIVEAGEQGFRLMYLDTFESMQAAIALYEKLGFREIAAYYENPYPGAHFMALDL